jgi:hypothetical protein
MVEGRDPGARSDDDALVDLHAAGAERHDQRVHAKDADADDQDEHRGTIASRHLPNLLWEIPLVELRRIELLTSSLRTTRSPS